MALPPHVASGELITSAWGNAVVDELTRLRGETRSLAGAIGGNGGTSGGGLQILDGLVPAQTVAGQITVWSHTRVDMTSGSSYNLELVIAGVVYSSFAFYTFVGFNMASMHATAPTLAGAAVQVIVRGVGAANVTVYADGKVNRADWLWTPNRNL